MKLQVGVKVLLMNDDTEYLILKRSVEKYPDVKNLWDIPGGRIESGAPLIENLERELREETGLKMQSEPQLVAAQDILKGNGVHVVRLTYLSRGSGTVNLDTTENIEFKWLPIHELRMMDGLCEYAQEVINSNIVE